MARGPGLDVVRCVGCPKQQGDYIAVEHCRLCPFFLAEAGRQIRCGYTFKKFEVEPNRFKEQVSRW